MYTSNVSQVNWCRQCWDRIFFRLYILQTLKTWFSHKYIFENLYFVQQILMNFARLVRVYVRHLTAKFQPSWCRQCWDMNFLRLYILQTLKKWFSQKYIFQNLHFVQQILMNFAKLVRVYVRHLTAKFQPSWCRQCWDMNFLRLHILQTLKTRFSQKYIFQNLHSVQQILMNFAG